MTFRLVFALLLIPLLCHCEEESPSLPYPYEVEFQGNLDEDTLNLLHSTSQLIHLKNSPPKTSASLKIRIDDDLINLHQVLQTKAFYHASIDASIDSTRSPILITVSIDTGPVYPFASFKIMAAEETCTSYPLDSICLDDLGVTLGSPAYPSVIFDAEDIFLDIMAHQGYPIATVLYRRVVADQSTKSIAVTLEVDTGPLATFGTTEIIGNKDILPVFFCKKIEWQEGQIYCPESVCRTLNALEASGLFSSINITNAEETLPDNSLPMVLTVKEGKHRSVAFGVGYATDLGPGVTAEWEHRNMRSRGERLRFLANIWQIKQEGFVRYIVPDFGHPRQDLIWQAEVEHEITKGFVESALILSGTIERQVDDNFRFSYGAVATRLRNSHSNNNGNFNIFKLPLQGMWTYTNSILDPTQGIGFHAKIIPAIQTLSPRCAYCTNLFTTTAYKPLDENEHFVLAAKAVVGSIYGTSDKRLPPSERFYAGSDSLLRGYRYLTVSPLGPHHKPIGGRSMMILSLESRMRIYDPFGVVLFYDVGNVYHPPVPQFHHKQLQSTGLGLRYHTPVGPIRIDIAFPLTPRRHLDSTFQLYFSIGQSF